MIPYYMDDRVLIYHGDALEVLGDLGDVSIDAVVTDPPYASGTRKESGKPGRGSMLRGEHKGTPRLAEAIDLDQMTTTGFVWLMRSVALACYDLLPPGASFLSFIDWRQWPALVGALETSNYRVQNMVVWDKGAMGLGNGFRNQHELVCHASKGVPNVHHRGTPNVLAAKRVPPKAAGHPSPKPVDLVAHLLRVAAPSGGTVLDPFLGSGATLEAAIATGRRCIGIERNADYCRLAAERADRAAAMRGAA